MTLSRSVLMVCSVLLAAGLLSSTLLAAAAGNTAPDQDKPQYPDAAAFPAYVQQLKAQALAHGISARVVEQAFAEVHFIEHAVQSDRDQPEKKITLDDYLQRVLPQPRIQKGREMLASHASALGPLSRQTGVPASIIIALWGMESSFGKIQGREDVISALATLAFEGRREAFFRQELIAALKIVDGGHIELEMLKGSWAGAMGQTQFMPSSYLKYAVDGDKDGKADIWASLPDVFASAANYLYIEGWQPGIGWGREVKLPAGFPLESAGLKDSQAKTADQWKVRGVTQPDGTPLKETDNPTWIIIPDDLQGRAFMVNANFRTLMHWNRSLYFALSIGLMSDEITSLSL